MGLSLVLRVVAGAGIDAKEAVPRFRQAQFHTDLVPLSVLRHELGTIGQQVLMPELISDDAGERRQFSNVAERKCLASGQSGYRGKQLGTQRFLFRVEVIIEDSDRIDQDVGLFCSSLDVTFTEAAAIVTTIRDDQ